MQEINFRAPLNLLGFGLFSFAYFKNMSKFAKINWEPVGKPDQNVINKLCTEFDVPLSSVVNALNSPLNTSLPLFTIWHHHDLAFENYDVRSIIHFETSTFTRAELNCVDNITKLAACSKWGKNIINANLAEIGVNPKSVVLPGIYASLETAHPEVDIDSSLTIEQLKERYNVEKIFISGGKWEKRKQHFRLLEKDFTSNTLNKVMIMGLWNNPFMNGLQEPIKALEEAGYKKIEIIGLSTPSNNSQNVNLNIYEADNNIIIALIDFIESMPFMHSLYKASDGYISISAGEGWDQPLVEAMSLGVPCLASNNTAHTEYINESNTLKVECTQEIAFDNIFFRGDKGVWYPPQQNSLIEKWQQFCLKDLSALGTKAEQDMYHNYTYMQNNLERLLTSFLE